MPVLELSLLMAALGASLLALRRLGLASPRALAALGVAGAALAIGVGFGPPPSQPAAAAPILRSGGDYVGSGACRSCHPGEYTSWHQSYHRSMTERASPGSVRAAWSGTLHWRGRDYVLERRGDEHWVRLPDPEQSAAAQRSGREPTQVPDVERQVVMTTGSHHYQAYWVPGARGNELFQFPFVYHFESQRFIARHDAFLQPEDDPVHTARWNSNCIQCHSVAGEPRHDLASDRFDSRAAELGIACEACHGPGRSHVAERRAPWQRLAGSAASEDLVNPARLDARRASEVCGQCHAYFLPNDPDGWWDHGFARSYRPGDDLGVSRRLLSFERGAPEQDPALGASLTSLFYAEGTVRVGGREWNGLSRSACFTRGDGSRQIACTSCHSLHAGAADDQLKPGDVDAPCRGCHQGLAPDHSHHAPTSSGDRCVSCHMPKTTYALFKSIRSHRITRPTADPDPGAPLDACNLCHQDRSLGWTRDWLAQWYGIPASESAPDAGQSETDGDATAGATPREGWSALAVAALSGDAAARVIAVAALGDATAREASTAGWQTQVLAEALDDPYAAVRFVAARSLRVYPGFDELTLAFDAPRAERLRQQAQVRQRAIETAAASPALPADAAGAIPRAVFEVLIRQRDTTPVRIAE